MANNLRVGYATLDVTPPLGVHIAGYFKERIADGVLDPLETVSLAIQSGDKTVLLITVDHCGIGKEYLDGWRASIEQQTGIPADAILIHCTHTHQGSPRTPF